MSNAISVLSLLVAVIAIAASGTLPETTNRFASWAPIVSRLALGAALLLSALLGWSVATALAARREKRAKEISGYIVIVKTIHDRLTGYGGIDVADTEEKIARLEKSEEAIWEDDRTRGARNDFTYQARRKFEVRKTRDDYRNEIERSEALLYLDSAKDRLVAALKQQKLPPAFNPFEEYETPWWRKLWTKLLRKSDDLDQSNSTDGTSESPPVSLEPLPSEPIEPAATKPPGSLPKSSWPRVAALMMREAKFTFSASSNGALEQGECHIDIQNSSRTRLEKCTVFVIAIDDGDTVELVEQALAHRNKDGGNSPAEFDLPAGQTKRLICCRRDLKDIISRPPWLVRLTGREHPLFDGKTYTLKIELRSNYEYPTLVALELNIDTQNIVSARIADQAV